MTKINRVMLLDLFTIFEMQTFAVQANLVWAHSKRKKKGHTPNTLIQALAETLAGVLDNNTQSDLTWNKLDLSAQHTLKGAVMVMIDVQMIIANNK